MSLPKLRASQRLSRETVILSIAAAFLFFACKGKGCGKKKGSDEKSKVEQKGPRKPDGREVETRRGPAPVSKALPIPSEADAAFEIHLVELRSLPVFKDLKRRLKGTLIDRFTSTMTSQCGLDLLTQVDGITGAVRFESNDAMLVAVGTGQMAAKTSACLPKLKQQRGLADLVLDRVKSHGYDAFDLKHESIPKVRFVRLDDNLFSLSAGDWLDLPTSMAQKAKASLRGSSYIYKIKKSLGRARISWLASLGVPPALRERLPSMASRIKTAGLGLDGDENGIKVLLSMDMRTASSASGLAGTARLFLPQLPKYNPAYAPFEPFIKKLVYTTKGPLLIVELALTNDELRRFFSVVNRMLRRYLVAPGTDEPDRPAGPSPKSLGPSKPKRPGRPAARKQPRKTARGAAR